MYVKSFDIWPMNFQLGDDQMQQGDDEPWEDFWDRVLVRAAEIIRSPEWDKHRTQGVIGDWKGRPMSNLELHAFAKAVDNDVVLAMRRFLASFDSFVEREFGSETGANLPQSPEEVH